MIVSKLARTTVNQVFLGKNLNLQVSRLIYRNFNSQSKDNVRARVFRSRTTRSNQTAESLDTPINIGRGVAAGASLLGIGALAYYGAGMGSEPGFMARSSQWPQYVRDRLRSTYEYFGASIGIAAGSAFMVYRNPTLMNLAMKSSIASTLISIVALIGTGMLVRSIPYEQGKFGSKQLAWILHSGLLGAMIAPLSLLGGPLITRAAWYTAGIVGGLSTIAATAPSEKFLNMGGPLAIGLGVVFASSIAGMFFPPTTRLGVSLYSVSIYGGLVLFSMFLLYDTQKIVKKAEHNVHFDPVNASISIFMDTINIFVRMVTILANGNRRK